MVTAFDLHRAFCHRGENVRRLLFVARVFVGLLSDNAFLGISAVGTTLVIFPAASILSVGAVIGFTSIFTATMIEQHHLAPGLAWVLALAAGAGLGAGMGALIHFFRLPAFLITLAGMFLARGAGFWINTDSVGVNHELYAKISGYELTFGSVVIPSNALILVVVMIAGYITAHHTRFGRNLLAVGGKRTLGAADGFADRFDQDCGICVEWVLRGSGGNCGDPLHRFGQPRAWASDSELDAIAIVVIGGTLLTGGRGHVFGTFLGILIFGTIQAAILFDGRLSSWWMRIVVGGLLLVFILLQRFFLRRKPGRFRAAHCARVPSLPRGMDYEN